MSLHLAQKDHIPFEDESPERLAASIAHYIIKGGHCQYREMLDMMRSHNTTHETQCMLPESWSLLISDGFIYPIDYNSNYGGSPSFVNFAATKRLKSAYETGSVFSMLTVGDDISLMLHPAIRNSSLGLFKSGKYQDAVMTASQRVEVHLRAVSNIDGQSLDDMAGRAFSKEGPFSKIIENKEGTSLMMLFRGMTQLVRNPTHHQKLDMEDKAECLRLLAFLSYLYHQLDAIELKLSNLP